MAKYYKPSGYYNYSELESLGIKTFGTENERALDQFCTESNNGQHRWLLLPQQEGQKQYLMCLDCLEKSHL